MCSRKHRIVVQYRYDNVGHLCVVSASSTSCGSYTTPYVTISSSNYDAAGRPLSATYGNGVVASASYSPETAELASLNYSKGTNTLFGLNYVYQKDTTNCPMGYGFGNNGQIQCISDTAQPGRNVSYTYDTIGRLLTASTTGSAAYPAWGLQETYDRYGNRITQTVTVGSGYSTSLTINSANNQISGYTYDASGNLIGEPAPVSTTFTYDGEECMTGYTGNGNSAAYTCDGNKLRVRKVVSGANAVTTVYVRAGGDVIAEYDNGAGVASPTREYIYGQNRLATITGSVSGSGGTIIYEHRDHLSPRLFTDVNGNNVGEQGTYPFGESWYRNTTMSQWVFTSYERDQESGLDDALARTYSANSGRFGSPDPLEGIVGDPQSWNRYAYVENDPINLTDPSGQGFWEDLLFAIFDIFVAIFDPPALPQVLSLEASAEADYEIGEIVNGQVLIAMTTAGEVTHRIWAPTCTGSVCGTGGEVSDGPGSSAGTGPESTGENPDGSLGGGNPGGQGTGNTGSSGNVGGSAGSGPGSSPTPTQGGPGNTPTTPTAAGDVWHEVTASQVAVAVKVFVKDSGKAPARVVNLLNGFGRNWTLSGANLREGFSIAEKEGTKIQHRDTVNDVLANINSIKRTGDNVLITNNKDIRVKLLAHLDSTISFTVVSGEGGPSLKNIEGVKIFEGFRNKAVRSWGP
jgi:RHS repeat-associated protein